MNDVKKKLEDGVINYFSTIKSAEFEAEKIKAEKSQKDQEKRDQSIQSQEQSQSE